MSDDPADISDTIKQATDTPPIYRVYDTVIGLDTPAPVSDIADLALCSEEEAAPLLEILHELRVITKEDPDGEDIESPHYCRNDAFFDWKRAATLADEFEQEELEEIRTQLRVQIETFQDIYNAEAVEDMSINTTHQGLQKHMREDAEQWALMEQTCRDIAFAQQLLERSED